MSLVAAFLGAYLGVGFGCWNGSADAASRRVAVVGGFIGGCYRPIDDIEVLEGTAG